MRRIFVMIWIMTMFVISWAVVSLSHKAKDLQQENLALNHSIQQKQENIHILHAEWSLLNNPTRLAKLSHEYLPKLRAPDNSDYLDTIR